MAALVKCARILPSCPSVLVKSVAKSGTSFESNGSLWLFSQKLCPVHLKLTRESSFLQHLTADKLWKGVTTVSTQGRRKGRGVGIGKKMAKDLNKGQELGVGKINMVWPGLNYPVVKGKEIVEHRTLPPDPDREEKMLKLRAQQNTFRRLKLDPLERGFSGVKWPGRSCGPPDSKKEGEFEGFDSKVLQLTSRSVMSGKFGRQRQVIALVVTGNKNGLAGFATFKTKDGASAIRQAKNTAGQSLRYIERYQDHTVFHDFYSKYNATELFVRKKPKGYGLCCNRVIKIICEMAGITDISVNVEGSTNPVMLTNAFFLGLKQQKTHQELADMIGLNVVEFRADRDYYPQLVAAPKTRCRTREEIPGNEITDYDEVIREGRLEKPYEEPPPPKEKSYWIGVKKRLYQRNHDNVRFRLLAKHGALKSFHHFNEEKRLEAEKVHAVTE